MINVKALNKLLTDNADHRLFRRWYIITPNGSLLAYTCPADIRELRDQVGLISLTWKEQLIIRAKAAHAADSDRRGSGATDTSVHTMTLEFDNRNVLVRQLQDQMLLVLEGGVPPRRKKPLRITVEGSADPRYPPLDDSDAARLRVDSHIKSNGNGNGDKVNPPDINILSSSGASQASTSASTARRRASALDLHRTKLDSLADFIRAELEQMHFAMPVDDDDRFI